TKLSGYLMDLPKTYVADVMLGASTDTHDATGAVTAAGEWREVTEDAVRAALPRFLGRRMQVPPMYSALKHRGTPLYTLARRGEQVDREPREVQTWSIELAAFDPPLFTVEVTCSRGMYVRVLAEELGAALGVPAHLHGLVRTRIGHFDVASAVGDGELERLAGMESPGHSLYEAMRHMPAVELTPAQTQGVRNGIAPRSAGAGLRAGTLVRLAGPGKQLEAIAEAGPGGLLELRRVFAGGE
ncbi:MAG: pseudouridine synthase, partial [Candidatus Krumholzibacteria bacterium]|nr:pseudouridine synthase [Candidatus Krumholzibacteria bacterium]